jgi:type I restriction enzyme, S subunit
MSYDNWKMMTLQDVCTKIGDGLHGTPNYSEDGDYYFINGNNLDENIIINAKTRKVDQDEFEKYRKDLSLSTILLSINGTLGNLAYYQNEKVVLGKSVCYINTRSDVYKRFIYYSLKTPEFLMYLDSHSTGTTIKNFGLKAVREYKFRLPSFENQIAIANTLYSFDNKIELNNKINKNLEELAQTLYKHWFVDFEFPNEEGKPYKSSGGEMVDSELTLIPAGWKISTISNISKSVLGGTPSRKKPNYWGGSINWIKSGELNNLRIIKPTETITEDGLNSSATKIMPIGTVLIGITGYVGAVSMLEIECSANQSVVGLLPSEGYPRSYLYGLIKNVITQIALKQTGSAQQHINKNDIDSHKIVLPNGLLIKELSNILEPIHQMISSNLSQNQRLVELRDTLLPKLMSGKIEV